MLVKGLLCVFIQGVLLRVALSQCIGSPSYPVERLLPAKISRIIGGNLVVDTSSSYEPAGVSIASENLIIEGTVLVQGSLPFLSTVALEGILPTVGSGTVSYECGNGNTGIVSEAPNIGHHPYGLEPGCINRIDRL